MGRPVDHSIEHPLQPSMPDNTTSSSKKNLVQERPQAVASGKPVQSRKYKQGIDPKPRIAILVSNRQRKSPAEAPKKDSGMRKVLMRVESVLVVEDGKYEGGNAGSEEQRGELLEEYVPASKSLKRLHAEERRGKASWVKTKKAMDRLELSARLKRENEDLKLENNKLKLKNEKLKRERDENTEKEMFWKLKSEKERRTKRGKDDKLRRERDETFNTVKHIPGAGNQKKESAREQRGEDKEMKVPLLPIETRMWLSCLLEEGDGKAAEANELEKRREKERWEKDKERINGLQTSGII